VRTTPDLKEALDSLEQRLAKVGGVRLKLSTSNVSPLGSLGREIRMSLEGDYSVADLRCLLWGNAIPCGFTPLDRYPNLDTETKDVFHFYGEWQMLLDNHLKEGQGEFVFSSLVCACKCELGVWSGDRTVERSIQSHLHRLGYSVGVITGSISELDLQALRALGLSELPLEKILVRLADFEKPKVDQETQTGHLVLPDIKHLVYSYGNVATTQTNNGVLITKRGLGRIIIDFP
jgi:hypothetical protein